MLFLFSVVPVGVPTVSVDKAGLEHGRPLIADCHAPPSYPATNITLYVNDERVSLFIFIHILLNNKN